MSEVWRVIEDHPDYEASSLGKIRRARPNQRGQFSGRLMKPNDNGAGYLSVCLHGECGRRKLYVHRLVCAAFNGPAPTNLHEVAHSDGCRSNNRAENLRWATRSENHGDKLKHGTAQQGIAHGNSKLTNEDVLQIRSTPKSHGSGKYLAHKYGVSTSLICFIRSRKAWTHIQESEHGF